FQPRIQYLGFHPVLLGKLRSRPPHPGPLPQWGRGSLSSTFGTLSPTGGEGRGEGATLPFAGFCCGCQGVRSRREDSLAALRESAGDIAQIAKQKIGPARPNEPRLLPNDEIIFISIARVASHEIKRDLLRFGRNRNLEA